MRPALASPDSGREATAAASDGDPGFGALARSIQG